jgi:hypothetical protein
MKPEIKCRRAVVNLNLQEIQALNDYRMAYGRRGFKCARSAMEKVIEAWKVAGAENATTTKKSLAVGNTAKLREAAKGLTTADIPKVRVRDNKGRVVCEGYYFEYPEHMGPGIYDGEPPPIPTVRGVVTYDQGDWNMANTPRFLRVTLPHTFEVIESEVAR